MEESVKYKIDTLCDIIASDLGVVIEHSRSGGETISAEFEESVRDLEKGLANRLKSWNMWKQDKGSLSTDRKFVEAAEDSDRKHSVWQFGFMGPLIREEISINPQTGRIHEREMAADHLLVVLTEDQRRNICTILKKLNFEGIHLDEISKANSLYRLYFQEDRNLKWLGTMNTLIAKIKERNLALNCRPNYIVKVDGNASSKRTEPWPYYNKNGGLNVPENLFNLLLDSNTNYDSAAPSNPIKIAVIDTGILAFNTQNGEFKTHSSLVDQILTNEQYKGRMVSYGYNAPEESKANQFQIFDHVKNVRLAENEVDVCEKYIRSIQNCATPCQNLLLNQKQLLLQLNDELTKRKNFIDNYQKKHPDERVQFNALNREKEYPKDFDGHGTHVAGIIAAKPMGRGAVPPGLAGIPNYVKLIICKFTSYKDKYGFAVGTIADAIKCVDYAKKGVPKLLIAVGGLSRRMKMRILKS